MSIDKQRLELEARLQVLEIMLSKLWATELLMNFDDPHHAADQLMENYRGMMSKETFGDDPAESDLIASEIEHAFVQFLSAVKGNLPAKGES